MSDLPEFSMLRQIYREALSPLAAQGLPEIAWCSRYGDGRFDRLAGFQKALEELHARYARQGALHPLLIFGFLSRTQLSGFATTWEECSTLSLLEWPGAEYLRYDVSCVDLRSAATRVIAGAKQPLPKHLLPRSSQDISKLLGDIRHWLTNRQTSVAGALKDFRAAAQGAKLSPFHLKSQPAVSEEHQKALDRLWAFESLALKLAPENRGIAPLRDTVTAFERAWADLERARTGYRDGAESGACARGQTLITQLELVAATVHRVIQATHDLDAALRKKP